MWRNHCHIFLSVFLSSGLKFYYYNFKWFTLIFQNVWCSMSLSDSSVTALRKQNPKHLNNKKGCLAHDVLKLLHMTTYAHLNTELSVFMDMLTVSSSLCAFFTNISDWMMGEVDYKLTGSCLLEFRLCISDVSTNKRWITEKCGI